MVNSCICCGNIIPNGVDICYVCFTCNKDNIKCPSCGSTLRAIHSNRRATATQILYSKIYNCTNCHSEWETSITGVKLNKII